ncbi:MAG: bifunctional 4-hydroxy-2-oxoglutarate aldolase/2-dehydro-3-deoxy-phosphogluconate aldolase [Paludibacteraceae bacterium]|nr:bifunctional 4-hydroxy-2-oxoglutarate aldolase/2-dehydro-3-deoxy-phosphogluconate aldolase [Paludibacteraceae bacterium]
MKTIQTAMQYAIVPVFYHDDKQVCQHVLQACYDGGIRIFEFTNRGENARDNFKYLRDIVSQSMPNLYLGVGSLITEDDAQYFIQNGADFLVSPIFSDAVWKVCLQQQVIYIPGCATPTEMGRAQAMGCEITKLFPGEVFGAQMVSAIMAPMPWSKIMVTGGVMPHKESIEQWFKAGAYCLGMGSKLLSKERIIAQDWQGITQQCQHCVDVVQAWVAKQEK